MAARRRPVVALDSWDLRSFAYPPSRPRCPFWPITLKKVTFHPDAPWGCIQTRHCAPGPDGQHQDCTAMLEAHDLQGLEP
jgi:hypothetical protein